MLAIQNITYRRNIIKFYTSVFDLSTSIMNFIRNRNFKAGHQTNLEGFICPQNCDKQQKINVFGRSGGVIWARNS